MSRIELLGPADVPSDALTSEEVAEGALNRTMTLARVDGLPTALNNVIRTLWSKGTISPLLKATAIVTVVRRSPYELAVNVPKALQAGVTRDMIDAIEDEDWTDPVLDDAQKAVVRFAMMFDAGHGIPDGEFERLRAHFDDSQIVELAGVCTQYGSLARLAIALAYPAET